MAVPSSCGRFTALALRGAASLLARRTVTTLGVRFPEGDGPGPEGGYGFSLYDGAAGVALVLCDGAAATRDLDVAGVADEVVEGLAHATPEGGALKPGLYDGFAGVALAHLAHARARRDSRSLERAVALGTRLAAITPPGADLISGAAGMGVVQLALLEATGSGAFLKGARRILEYLADTAAADGPLVHWAPGVDDGGLQPGLAHGVAGPCLFLTRMAALEGNRTAARLRDGGFRWLEVSADRLRGGAMTWPHHLGASGRRWHWCHGAVGVAQAHLALHRHTGRADALLTAERAAEGTWTAMSRRAAEATCHCHGRAGAIELFQDLALAGSGGPWRARAEALALGLLGPDEALTPRGRPRRGPSTLGGLGAGLSMGTAGVVRELLRLGGHEVFPILGGGVGRIVPASPRRPSAARATVPSGAIPHRGRRPLRTSELRDLLPRVAARTDPESPAHGRSVVLGPPDPGGARAVLRALARSGAGDAWFEARERIERGCARLARRHRGLLAPGVLGPSSAGSLLRELAGLALREGADRGHMRGFARASADATLTSLATLLERLETDTRGALAREVGGRVTGIEVHGGDPHRGGERVVALSFEEGPRLLYKSRSVALDRELAGAVGAGESPTLAGRCRAWLAPSVEGGLIPTHRIVAAGRAHGYVERVEGADESIPSEVETELHGATAWAQPAPRVTRLRPGEERRYWYSAGLLAGHAFSLGISDLHAENVRCGTSRSTPDVSLHAVDLEVAFTLVDGLRSTGLAPTTPAADRRRADAHSHAGLDFSLNLDCGLGAEDWTLALTPRGVRPEARPRASVLWSFPHLAQNPDGSFGFGAELCAFLRGMADQWWTLRSHRREVAGHLRAALTGHPVRFLAKATQSYQLTIERLKAGGALKNGIAHGPEWPQGLPLTPSELRQLERLDYPYFFQPLGGTRKERAPTLWLGPSGRAVRAPEMDAVERLHAPFWSIVGRQGDGRFSTALVEAVRMVEPEGPFDFHDRHLGVRAFRTAEDPRLVIVVLLGPHRDSRLTCRAAADGTLEWKMD